MPLVEHRPSSELYTYPQNPRVFDYTSILLTPGCLQDLRLVLNDTRHVTVHDMVRRRPGDVAERREVL